MLREGQVVVLKAAPQEDKGVRRVEAGQKGTLIHAGKEDVMILLTSGDIWVGPAKLVYLDQPEEKDNGSGDAASPDSPDSD